MKKIAVCGKGGVGKSFITYALSKVLAKKGYSVIVIDTDESNQSLYRLFGYDEPPQAFMDFLGGKKMVQQSIIKRFQSGNKESKMSVIEKETFQLHDIPPEFLKVNGSISLINIGKIKEPLEGCACPMGIISREFLEKIQLKENEIIIVDTEAGIEHFGRGVEKGIDTIVVVAEPYLDSIEVAQKIVSLADQMDKRVYFLVNKVFPENEEAVKDVINRKALPLSGMIYFSPLVYRASIEGKVIDSDEIFTSIEKFVEKMNG